MGRGFTDSTGNKLPSISKVIDVLAKPALIGWANKIGLQGITIRQYTDPLKAIGTLTHAMIAEDLGGAKVDRTRQAPDVLAQAQVCFGKYLAWKGGHKVEPILVEADLVSEEHSFGGRPDCVAKVDGVVEVISAKTARAIYDEAFLQVAAERQLAVENGHEAERVRILQVGRSEEEGFGERLLTAGDAEPFWNVFEHALAIYELQQWIEAAATVAKAKGAGGKRGRGVA